MITFGYKSKFSAFLRAGSAIGIGLVMLFATDATITVVKIIASLLFAAGLISLIYGLLHKEDSSMPLMIANAVVDVVLGIVLFLFPAKVSAFIVYLIGFCLLAFGALQLIVLISAMSLIGGGFMALAMSILAIIGGIVLIYNPFSIKVMSILAGIMLIIYGVAEILSMWRVDKAVDVYEIKFAPTEEEKTEIPRTIEAKEVEYQKADEEEI